MRPSGSRANPRTRALVVLSGFSAAGRYRRGAARACSLLVVTAVSVGAWSGSARHRLHGLAQRIEPGRVLRGIEKADAVLRPHPVAPALVLDHRAHVAEALARAEALEAVALAIVAGDARIGPGEAGPQMLLT